MMLVVDGFVHTGLMKVLHRGAGVCSLPLRTQVVLVVAAAREAAALDATAPETVRSC